MSETKRKFKDVKSESAGIEFIRPSKLAEAGTTGVILEGTFVGSVPNSFDDQKLDYKFEKEDGGLVILNGAGNLNYNMKQVDIGEYIRVSYEGKQEITKGAYKGRSAHNFKVEREDS